MPLNVGDRHSSGAKMIDKLFVGDLAVVRSADFEAVLSGIAALAAHPFEERLPVCTAARRPCAGLLGEIRNVAFLEGIAGKDVNGVQQGALTAACVVERLFLQRPLVNVSSSRIHGGCLRSRTEDCTDV